MLPNNRTDNDDTGTMMSTSGGAERDRGGETMGGRDEKETTISYLGVVAENLDEVVDSERMLKNLHSYMQAKYLSIKITAPQLEEKMPLVLRNGKKITHSSDNAYRLHPIASSSASSSDGATPSFACSSCIERRKAGECKGNGFFATRDIPVGTLVLVEKPLVCILDSDLSKQPWADDDSGDTQALFIALGEASRKVLPLIAPLHPQSARDKREDDPYHMYTKKAYEGIPCEEIERYRQVCRYNMFGFYTNSEQICYHYTYRHFTGAGLFALASTFNHSCEPNIGRYSLGDATFFRTSRPVKAGEELCISYIEAETLVETKRFRHQVLNRDFTCTCRKCTIEEAEPMEEEGAKNYADINAELLAELNLIPEKERAETIESILSGELFDDPDAGSSPIILGKDVQELRCLLANAYMAQGLFFQARKVWIEAYNWLKENVGNDEALSVFLTQAWLCTLETDRTNNSMLQQILAHHSTNFGGGVEWYRERYTQEVNTSKASQSAKDAWLGFVS